MDAVRAGKVLRVVRRRRRWTQLELAARASVAQQTVSLLERGLADDMTLRSIKRVAAPLGISVDLTLRWRGPELDRLLDARHAELVKAVVSRLGPAWQVLVEYSFNEYGDRGSVDVIGWNAGSAALVLIEVKSELDGLETVLRPIDVKARVVPGLLSRERRWRARSVGAVLVLPDESSARRSVARLGRVLDVALPARTVAVRRWLSRPAGPCRGIWFLADTPTRRAVRNPGSPGPVGRPRTPQNHAQRPNSEAPTHASEPPSTVSLRIAQPPGVADGNASQSRHVTPTRRG
jgi:transcriptional regulator with XRE-family HTH domain